MIAVEPAAAPPRSNLWGCMPSRIKVLFVTTLHHNGSWLHEAFATDSATEIVLEEAVGVTAGLAKLRDEVFDVVLASHEPGVLDAVDLIEGLRGGGHDEAMIVLGAAPASQMDALCYEVGADAYCCTSDTTTRTLLWTFARAIERSQLVRENRRLVQADRQRLAQEHQEAQRLLDEQRALIADLEVLRDGEENDHATTLPPQTGDADCGPATLLAQTRSQPRSSATLPEPVVKHYHEMLRAYVVMGAGNLGDEMDVLAELLADAGVSAQQAMQVHVHVLEELISGLGSRSARHVMNRADLLILEVMAHLADGYRGRYHRRMYPPQQQLLPGFDCRPQPAFLRPAA